MFGGAAAADMYALCILYPLKRSAIIQWTKSPRGAGRPESANGARSQCSRGRTCGCSSDYRGRAMVEWATWFNRPEHTHTCTFRPTSHHHPSIITPAIASRVESHSMLAGHRASDAQSYVSSENQFVFSNCFMLNDIQYNRKAYRVSWK